MNKQILTIIFIMSLTMGCAVNKGKSLIVGTVANVGLKVGMSEINQTPELKLGYNRLEFGVIPVSDKQVYTAPVLTRFNFISMIKNPGIESLIATGSAVHPESLKASSLP